ncbi:hypothetical protein [Spiribacter vilamensis]|nr:hypothetical protein [Spiribacter vilamensis]
MSSAEYLAVAAGLVGVWSGVDRVIKALGSHGDGVLWTLAIPL